MAKNMKVENEPDASEQIPMGSECSLFISSKRFFEDIMPQSLRKSGWSMVGVGTSEIWKNWSGEISQGSLTAFVRRRTMRLRGGGYSG